MDCKIWNLLSIASRTRSKQYLLGRCTELLIGYPLLIFSYCCYRNKKKWVFGTNVGFIDNAKYLFLYVNENYKDIRPIWISPRKEDINKLRALGFEAYEKYSLKGLYHSLTSRVYIFTYHSKDINYFTSGGAVKVNLWHGVGIKGGKGGKLENNYTSRFNASLFTKIFLPHLYESNDLFLSTSDMMDKHFKKMFDLNDEIIFDAIYPRCYYMCKEKNFMLSFIEKYESEDLKQLIQKTTEYKRVFLYMPTWRGGMNDDFIHDAGFDFADLNSFLKKENMLFIFKLHPAVLISNNIKGDSYSNIVFFNKKWDIYPVLPFTHVLITDYSSIYYDYILLDKEVILYPFDKKSFLEKSNDLAFDYDIYTPGYRVDSITELKNALVSNQIFKIPDRERILESFWGKTDFRNLDILCHKIKAL